MTVHGLLVRLPVVALALCGLLVVPSGGAAIAVADSAMVRTGESARIDRWVDDRMAARDLPGVAVAVFRGGRLVHLAGYGVADDTGRPVTPDTPFLLGSVSKAFTAAVVAQLVEEGVLSWDDPVWPHLAHLVDQPPAGFETVTIQQLVTHTAGLGMFVGVAGEVKVHSGPDALDRRVGELLSRPLAGTPGDGFAYSNAGPMLLAAVVEQVTGEAFADQLHDRVLDPLGMDGSFATAGDPRAADLATGHRHWFGHWRPAALPFDDAGVAMGYVASTAADLATFMQAHLEGHPAVPASAADIATGPVEPTRWTSTLDAGYGRGWFVDDLAGTTIVSHPGSLGHVTAHVLLAPDADLGIAVVIAASAFLAGGPGDRGHDVQYDLGFGLLRILLGEKHQPVDPTPLMTVALPVGAWAVVALLPIAVIRPVLNAPHRNSGAESGASTRRLRLRRLLPAVLLLVVGAALLSAPLGMTRHFHPDTGWAVTIGAWLALALGAVRLVLTLAHDTRRSSWHPSEARCRSTPGRRMRGPRSMSFRN